MDVDGGLVEILQKKLALIALEGPSRVHGVRSRAKMKAALRGGAESSHKDIGY